MRRFLHKSFLFTLPTLILLISVELFIAFSPNTFYLKSKFFKKNINRIEVLVLGSSHHQNAINPSFIDLKTANLAYGGQDMTLDSSLFFKYHKKLIKLKIIVLEYDYLTFNKKKESDYFRLPWYYRFYGVEPYPISLLKKVSLYVSSPVFFNNYIEKRLFSDGYDYEYNDHGFITNDFPGVFESLNYDINKIRRGNNKELKRIKKELSIANFEANKLKLNSIINYCKSNDIIVILSKTPTYIMDEMAHHNESVKLMQTYMGTIKQSNDIFVLDMSTDNRFKVQDFKDYTHLNSNGAIKYSKILNDFLKTKLDK